jgi:hypothetical protein
MAIYSVLNDCLPGSGPRDNDPCNLKSSPYGHLGSQVPLDMNSFFDVDEQVPSLHIPDVDLRYRAPCTYPHFDQPLPLNSHLFYARPFNATGAAADALKYQLGLDEIKYPNARTSVGYWATGYLLLLYVFPASPLQCSFDRSSGRWNGLLARTEAV